MLVIVDTAIVLTARTLRETTHLALWHKSCVGAYPRLAGIEVLESVLLLVLPLHVSLFILYGIPPDIEEAVGPSGAAHEEGAEVEAGAVLGDNHVDAGREVVADRGGGDSVEVGRGGGVGDVEGVVDVDVAVDVGGKVVEEVVLEGVGGFHDECVEVEPPEPAMGQLKLMCNMFLRSLAEVDSPLGFRILLQTPPYGIDLLPAFPPFVRISFLDGHVHNLEIVAVACDVTFLVSYTVSLYSPFPGPLPFHDTATLVCCYYHNELVASA